MKTIKSVLIGALVALLGSSAWAGTIYPGEINLSQTEGMNVIVISNGAEAVSWNSTSNHSSSDEEIATLINQNGDLAVKAGTCDGDVKVQFDYDGDTYVYTVHCTTVELAKKVKAASETDPNNKSNATIQIVSHLLKDKKPTPPNVLFFGTRCGAHTLTAEKLLKAINAIKDVGNVDWYTFGNFNESVHNGSIGFGGPDLTSIADMGNTTSGHHYSLKLFYNQFDAIIADPALSNKYDFIVIETDGSRVANEYGTSERGGGNRVDATWSAQEERVATWLKPFYDKQKVIWIVDDGYDYDNYKNAYSGHDLDKLFSYGTKYDKPYRPNNVTMKNSGSSTFFAEILSDTQLKGLLGIFDPDSYFAFGASGERLETYDDVDVRLNGRTTTTTTKAGAAIENQIFYDAEAAEIAAGLQSMIHPVIYDIGLVDNVVEIDDSLVIANNGVRFYEWPYDVDKKRPADADDPDWKEVKPCPVKITGNRIENKAENITNECYQMVQIDILVKDDFLAKAITAGKAKFVPSEKPGEAPGYYEFDPNDGPAVADVWRGVEGEEPVHCQTVAQTTMNKWNFRLIQATLELETESVEKTYDGVETNITVKSVLPALADFGGKLEYSTDFGANWSETNPKFKNVTAEEGTSVWCRVTYTDPLVIGTTNKDGRVTITPRAVTIKSGSKTNFVYDGQPHAYADLETVTGFADNEGLKETNGWATVTTVAESPKDNAFTYELKDNTLERNYTFTVMTGKVGVVAAPIDPVEPADPSDNPGDEPDPTDGPTIWAQNIVKAYDGIGTNVIAKVYNAVDGNTFTYEYSTNKIDFVAWDALQFTNVVAAQKVWYRAMTAQGNYLGVTNFAFVTITPRQIRGAETEDEPWARATGVNAWTNDCPSILVDGTNITVDVTLYGDDEPTDLEYSLDGSTWYSTAEGEEPAFRMLLSEVMATQVICRVSCEPNYIPTNVTAMVYIRSKESKPDDEEAKDEDKLQDPDATGTIGALKTVLEVIVANKSPSSTKPGFAPNQLDADLQLKVTSIENLPDVQPEKEKTTAEEHLRTLINKYANDPNYSDVNGKGVDIKLMYKQSFANSPDVETNIGRTYGNLTYKKVSDKQIPFTLKVNLENCQLLEVGIWHTGAAAPTKLNPRSGNSVGYVLHENGADSTITFYVDSFSMPYAITGNYAPPPAVIKGAQVADYRASVYYVDMKEVSGMLNGTFITAHLKYVEQANVVGYVVYNDCACNNADPSLGSQNPAWLVVTSDKATTTLPRVLPADLVVRMWDRSLGTGNTVEAAGYLFAGKGKGGWSRVAPWMVQTAYGVGLPTDGYKFGNLNSYATTELFGMYNLAEETAPGVYGNFFESWMDHAGFGKGSQNPGQQRPCTLGTQSAYCLQTLQGDLIGGLFLCWENGHGCTCATTHDWFVCQEWTGTSDVISGVWAMRHFTNVPQAVALDAAVEPTFWANNRDLTTPCPAAGMFGMLKAAVIGMRNFGCTATDLGYLEDAATAAYLSFGDTPADDAPSGANGAY